MCESSGHYEQNEGFIVPTQAIAAEAARPIEFDRRRFILGTAAATGLLVTSSFWRSGEARAASAVGAHEVEPGLNIYPREFWAQGLEPTGPLEAEEPKFLLVHHTAEARSTSAEQSAEILQGHYRYHTGTDKGWPDIAYNFLIDDAGNVFEGRSGSLAGPVRGSATGGNQGYSQLVCLMGNFEQELPPHQMYESLVKTLAWLAKRYEIDVAPEARTSFTSLGSNRYPAGETIDTYTIAGHRDMSETTCPGDAFYPYVQTTLQGDVYGYRTELDAQAPAQTTPPVGSTPPPTGETTTDGTTQTETPAEDGEWYDSALAQGKEKWHQAGNVVQEYPSESAGGAGVAVVGSASLFWLWRRRRTRRKREAEALAQSPTPTSPQRESLSIFDYDRPY